ncbi:MAG: GHKL domain-containing protein [Roseburia sp.]|nr:GHKL domain-containing protein [Roseburia sp.]MCM1241803.1 GHKL domain-containing protein [Roseburia sp.]
MEYMEYADILLSEAGYLGYLWAADKFCKKYLGTSRKRELLFVISAFGGCLCLEFINMRYPAFYILFIILNQIFFTGLVMLFFHSEWEKKILAASLLILARRLTGNFSVSLLSCLLLFLRHTVGKVAEPFMNEWESGLCVCIGYGLIIAAVYWMSKRLASVFYPKNGKWYLILAVPLLMMTAVDDVAAWGASRGVMVRSGGSMSVYYDQIFSHAGVCVLSLLSIFAAGVYISGMDRLYLEQVKSGQYQAQIAVYKMLEEQHRQSERLRHDMKNHVIVLSGLYENKEWEKLGEYLKNMGEGIEAGGDMTGNKALDALLYQKRNWAERENIGWECDVHISETCSIRTFDLCVLFGNLLDNALEACGRLYRSDTCGVRQRFVNIRAGIVKKCFLLEVKNSMDKAEEYAEGVTQKKDLQGHGIGLLNVRDVVRRYNGAVDMEMEDGIFMISVLLPLYDAARDIKEVV